MRRLRLAVDLVLAWFLVLLGCVHNFVVAPRTFDQFSPGAMWFLGAGLSLWYAAFLNLLRAHAAAPPRLLRVLCGLTNVTMLAFVVMFAGMNAESARLPGLALILAVAGLTASSLWPAPTGE